MVVKHGFAPCKHLSCLKVTALFCSQFNHPVNKVLLLGDYLRLAVK